MINKNRTDGKYEKMKRSEIEDEYKKNEEQEKKERKNVAREEIIKILRDGKWHHESDFSHIHVKDGREQILAEHQIETWCPIWADEDPIPDGAENLVGENFYYRIKRK